MKIKIKIKKESFEINLLNYLIKKIHFKILKSYIKNILTMKKLMYSFPKFLVNSHMRVLILSSTSHTLDEG